MYKVEVFTEDGKPITERTGTSKCIGSTAVLPRKDHDFFVLWDNYTSNYPNDPSPGVRIASTLVENIGSEYRIVDVHGRYFRVKILSETNQNT